MKKAILFGASGLVGSHLLQKLCQDSEIESILVFNRRSLGYSHSKIVEQVVDFNQMDSFQAAIQGDFFFIALGTTINKAGSKTAFEIIDLDLPVKLARAAKLNGVDHCAVISSLGADSNSSNFYLNVKGRMEDSIQALGFKRVQVFRPSMLLGERKEFRLGEWLGKNFMSLFSFVFVGNLKKYRAIDASQVANAMRLLKDDPAAVRLIESNEIQGI